MGFDRTLRTSFSEVARLYDEVRPGYPDALFEDIVALSSIPKSGKILEIGPGPGKATLPFARRGYEMLCLELGKDLAVVLEENCKTYPQVQVESIPFEDWPLQEEAFDLVISAQAFHWILPEIGYPKAAKALKTSGSLALFWNFSPVLEDDFFRQLDEIYKTHAPHLEEKNNDTLEVQVRRFENQIINSGLFHNLQIKRYPWSETYDTKTYLKLLQTHSDHPNQLEKYERNLFQAIGKLIDENGGTFEKPYVAVLYLGNKR